MQHLITPLDLADATLTIATITIEANAKAATFVDRYMANKLPALPSGFSHADAFGTVGTNPTAPGAQYTADLQNWAYTKTSNLTSVRLAKAWRAAYDAGLVPSQEVAFVFAAAAEYFAEVSDFTKLLTSNLDDANNALELGNIIRLYIEAFSDDADMSKSVRAYIVATSANDWILTNLIGGKMVSSKEVQDWLDSFPGHARRWHTANGSVYESRQQSQSQSA